MNYFRSSPTYVITLPVPERHRRTDGLTDRRTDDIPCIL